MYHHRVSNFSRPGALVCLCLALSTAAADATDNPAAAAAAAATFVGDGPSAVPAEGLLGPAAFNETLSELEAEFLRAAEANDVERVKALLPAVDHRSQVWRVPPCAAGRPPLAVTMVTTAGGPQNHEDDTALFAAAAAGAFDVVRFFLDDLGHAVDLVDHDDATLLLVAAAHGHCDVVDLLLARGADRTHRDVHQCGHTAGSGTRGRGLT